MRAHRWYSSGATCAASAFLIAGQVHAATFFVDVSHPAATDGNPGSEDAPWATIQHAADTVAPGDDVQVKAGSYPERVVIKTGGAAGAKLTLRAVPSRAAKMFGFNVVAPHVRIEGFDITNVPELDGWDETQGVFIQSDHVEVVDNYFHDMASAGVVGYWHDPFPNRAVISRNRMYRMQMGITVQGTGWLVEGNEVERLYMFAGGGDCDYSRLFGDGHVVRNNYFHGTDFSEIGSAHVDCFQTFDNNGEHLRDVLIDGNTCFDFHQAFMGEASFHKASSHIVFTNNLFAHGGAWGLCVHQITDVQAYNNTFYDIAFHGAGFRDGATGVVRNNIFMKVSSSYWASDGGKVTGDYNVIMGSSAPDTPGANDLVNVDPLFVDAANNDFHLSADSPAIDKGEARADLTADHDGVARPQGSGWDIGAYEYCADSCPSAPVTPWGGFSGSSGTGGGGTGGQSNGCACRLHSNRRTAHLGLAPILCVLSLLLLARASKCR